MINLFRLVLVFFVFIIVLIAISMLAGQMNTRPQILVTVYRQSEMIILETISGLSIRSRSPVDLLKNMNRACVGIPLVFLIDISDIHNYLFTPSGEPIGRFVDSDNFLIGTSDVFVMQTMDGAILGIEGFTGTNGAPPLIAVSNTIRSAGSVNYFVEIIRLTGDPSRPIVPIERVYWAKEGKISNNSAVALLSLDPDGSTALYVSELESINKRTTIFEAETGEIITSYEWSWNGNALYFLLTNAFEQKLMAYQLESGEVRLIGSFSHPSGETSVVVHPEDNMVSILHSDSQRSVLTTIDTISGEARTWQINGTYFWAGSPLCVYDH